MPDSKRTETSKSQDKPKPTWHAHFKSGEEEPVAIFRDDAADYAQQFRKSLPDSDHFDTAVVEGVSFNLKPDAKEHLKAKHDARFPPPSEKPVDDFKAAEIRNEMNMKHSEDELRAKVEKEMKEQGSPAKPKH